MSPLWDVARGPTGVRLLVEVGCEHGLAREACLLGTSLIGRELGDPHTQIEAGDELQVARNLIERLGDLPGLGVDAGRRLTFASMGIWGFALLSSPTWGEALNIATRFARLTPIHLRLEVEAGDGELRVVLHDDDIPGDVRDILCERDLATALVLLRSMLGPRQPARIETRLHGARGAALAALVPTLRVVTGRPRHFIAGDPALFAGPLSHVDPHAWRASKRACVALLDQRRVRAGMAARVRSRLLVQPAAMPSMQQIATELHVDVRTLRRQLTAEATTFRGLVEEVREILAAELLTTSGLDVAEVSRRLGYADATSFTHAFKRWTGVPPGTYRDGRAARGTKGST